MEFYHTFVIKNKNIDPVFNKSVTGYKDGPFHSFIEKFSGTLKFKQEIFKPYGITADIINEVISFPSTYIDTLVEIEQVKSKTLGNSLHRSDLKGEIYAICKHISTLGKLTWQKTDELKYKDYLITKPKKRGRKVGSKNKAKD